MFAYRITSGSQVPKKAPSSKGSDKIRKSSSAIVNYLDMDGCLLAMQYDQ